MTTDRETIYRVSEIFGPTIQGEGAQIGAPTVFVRLGGCDYRCSWCDSLYAVLPEHRATWTKMTAEDIMAKVNNLSGTRPILITLSGGNPAIQPCADLIALGHRQGHAFTMETQGSAWRPWFEMLDHLCVSPKPPSSGMATDWDVLQKCLQQGPGGRTILKVVVFDDVDLEYAAKVRAFGLDLGIPLYLQVGNDDPQVMVENPLTQFSYRDRHRTALLEKLDWLTAEVLERGWFDVRVLPQLHVLMYGNQRAV